MPCIMLYHSSLTLTTSRRIVAGAVSADTRYTCNRNDEYVKKSIAKNCAERIGTSYGAAPGGQVRDFYTMS